MHDDMKQVGKVLGFVLALVIVALVVLLLAARAWGSDQWTKEEEDKAWQEYEEASQKAGAGEVVPLPDDTLTPHDVWCEKVEGWCPTVTNGVLGGMRWCLGKPGAKAKPKCYTSHRKRTYQILLDWWGYLKDYIGGQHPLYKAGTVRTESEGMWDASTNSSTWECGLASIDRAKAKAFNVNACDAKANLWVAGQLTNLRLIRLREKYQQLVQAPLSDQWKLAGACGAIGTNKVHNLIDASGALRTKDDGTLYYAHPHDRILKWLMWADKTGKVNFYSYEGVALLGHNPGRGAFRVARSVAAEELYGDMVGGVDNLYGEPELAPRPDDLYPYPGDAKHCKCSQWPELADRHPDPVASVPGVEAP